jgi:hypothetical protein
LLEKGGLKMITKKLLDGCRNYVDWADVTAGSRVMILCPRTIEEEVVEALIIAVEDRGAEAYQLTVPDFSMYGSTPNIPYFVNKAAENADIVLSLEWGFGLGEGGVRSLKEFLARHGTSFIRCRQATVASLSSEQARYPSDLLYKIADKVNRKVLGGKTLRVTTRHGTDATMKINPDYWGGNSIKPKKPGSFVGGGFPGIVMGIVPWEPFDGVVAADMLYPKYNPPEIFLSEPLRITVENCRATKIEGPYADYLAGWLDRDKNGRWGAECMFGFHPHACPREEDNVLERFTKLHDRSTTLHFAFGNSIGGAGPHYSRIHMDVYMFNVDVYVDDFKLIDYGSLTILNDPEIREEACKFGDPDYLLTQLPLPESIQKLIDFQDPSFVPRVSHIKGLGD